LSGCRIRVGIDESAEFGVVIAGLKIIVGRLFSTIRATSPKSGHFSMAFDKLN
jgi:hypothetical protein